VRPATVITLLTLMLVLLGAGALQLFFYAR
jgi:hypothetical protein